MVQYGSKFCMYLRHGFVLLLLLIPFMGKAQTSDKMYAAHWKKIDSLINKKGLPKDAIAEVEKLSARATQEKNEPQRLKALVYRIILTEPVQDAPVPVSISMLEKEMSGAAGVSRAILQNMLAEQYWRYLQNNRFRLYDRTNLAAQKNDNINTWTAADLHQKISTLYQASLQTPEQLQSVQLSAYEPLIRKGNMRHLRPTMYDLLAFRALEYYTNEERTIIQPKDPFRINMNAAFDPADQFVKVKFPSSDSGSLYHKALLLFQDIIRFHLYDKTPDALLDADIKRLSFVRDHAVQSDKDELWRMSVRHLTSQYGQTPAAAQAWYLLAEDLAEKAASYQPFEDTTHRYAYKEALAICDKVLTQPDSSEGKTNCAVLARDIRSKEIQLHTEQVNVPGQPFRSLVSFRNISGIHIRYIRMTSALKTELKNNNFNKDFWKRIVGLPAFRNAMQSLPVNDDYQTHKTEIAHEVLPVGDYLLLVANDADFSPNSSLLALQQFHVSNIGFVQKGRQVYVVNRDSGVPLAGASVELWMNQYDYNTRKSTERKIETVTTNKNGLAAFTTQEKEVYNMRFAVQWGKERLQLDDAQYVVYWNNNEEVEEKRTNRTYLFTDRSIYRPGQTVQVKGLIVAEARAYKAVQPGITTTLYLYDANYKAIDSVKVTTNRFGSYAASFRLPENKLNGNFQLRDAKQQGYASFSVEEYKRPKFSVELKQPSGMFRLNDSVHISGNALAFAGNNISDAEVAYKVTRTRWIVYYPWFGRSVWPPQRPGNDAVILNGTARTDDQGNFSISFKAMADMDRKADPNDVFLYQVEADVTDVNGETRSAQTSVRIGYKSVTLAFSLPAEMPADSLKQLYLFARNSSDSAQSLPATIHIHQLKTPDRNFRERLWERPDQFVLSKEAYYAAFPHDIYSNENEVMAWPKQGEAVYSSSYHTTTYGEWEQKLPAFKPGWYMLEASVVDAFGEQVTTKWYMHLTGAQKTGVMYGIHLETIPEPTVPGQKLTAQWQTNLPKPVLLKDVMRSKSTVTEHITGNKTNGAFDINTNESDRGGLNVMLTTVKHNRVYTTSTMANIFWNNKLLKIETTTFRDKLLPGAKETWSFTVKPSEGTLDTAEVLAAMYDASLDDLKPHQWNRPYWPNNYSGATWQGNGNFGATEAQVKEIEVAPPVYLVKSYDGLFTPENAFEDNYYGFKGTIGLAARSELSEVAVQRKDIIIGSVSKVEGKQFTAPEVVPDFETAPPPAPNTSKPAIRANFSETAFFFPQLTTGANGALSFSFTIPESLTRWKFMGFAHTTEMASGYLERTVVTQKDLMLQPNLPRFLREGDRIDLSTKIANLTDKEMTGQVELQLLDADTRKPVDGWFQNVMPNQYFTAKAKGSAAIRFSIQIPYQYAKPLVVRMIARSGDHNDGEETILPVLANKILVTETLPVFLQGDGVKKISWDKLKKSGESETLQHQRLTVEFTSNPTWYVVQALPSLHTPAYPSADSWFNKLYAQAIGAAIFKKSPRLKAVIDTWLKGDSAALISPLEKNPELKNILLEETPWVLESGDQQERMRRLRFLLNMAAVEDDMQQALTELKALQTPNGGFSWFPNGPDNRYITQYITTGIGRLKKNGMLPASLQGELEEMAAKAVVYLDLRLLEDYNLLLKKKVKMDAQQLGAEQVYHLYMRSFFPDQPVDKAVQTALTYYRKQSATFWQKQSRYVQGLIAQVLLRNNEPYRAAQVLNSIRQYAVRTPGEGMYWKENRGGYYWYQSPVEVQSLLIEAFAEKGGFASEVNDMKTWLLRLKQTTDWGNSVATANACYALLMNGADWLNKTPLFSVTIGGQNLTADSLEAGTGYFKKQVQQDKISAASGDISIKITGAGTGSAALPAWGAVYWQYFEQLDRITSAGADSTLSIKRVYYKQKETDAGTVLEEINNLTPLKPGDKLVVRMVVTTGRNMEFVHLKDQRAASLEPVQVLSRYQWKNGLGYYQTVKDASVQFFFDWLPKGTHVLEYPLFITHTGVFSSGIGTVQSLYAPEFAGHSEGSVLRVEE